MKSLSLAEIAQVRLTFLDLIGSRVQNIFYQGDQYLLELWSPLLKKQYIIFDIHKSSPFCFGFSFKPRLDNKVFKSPVGLFSKRHLKGKKLVSVFLSSEVEGVLSFDFESFLIKFQMLPYAANLTVNYDNKTLHWNKVKTQPVFLKPSRPEETVRSPEELGEQWKNMRIGKLVTVKKKQANNELIQFFQAKIKKTKRAILKNKEDIKKREDGATTAKKIALLLQEKNQLSALDAKDLEGLSGDRSWAWNMDDQFSKYKKLTYKLKQTQVRQKVLDQEMQVLDSLVKNPFLQTLDISLDLTLLKKCKIEQIPALLLRGEASYEASFKKGLFKKLLKPLLGKLAKKSEPLFSGVAKRSLLLDSGVMVVAGKNAKANIALLRQARPWHTWVHLRDYPSSHAIILADKLQVIKDIDIIKVGQWLTQLSSKKGSLDNIKVDLVYTQCRFVKSIKADSLGRVSYKNEKSILL